MTFVHRLTASFLGLATIAACGAGTPSRPVAVEEASFGPPMPLSVAGTVFRPGERMNFELSLRGIVGGEALVAVGNPGEVDGKRVIIVRSRTESTGVVAVLKEVRDEVTSWVHVDTGLPVYHHSDVKFGEKEATVETHFNGGAPGSFYIHYDRKERSARKYRQLMPTDQAAFDGHSIIGAIRGWDAAEGSLAYFYVLASKRLWQNTVRLTRREKVKTSLGRFQAYRIDGVAVRLTRSMREDPRKDPRRYSVWISADEDRLPLLVVAKTEYGDVRAELTEYTRPDLPAISRR